MYRSQAIISLCLLPLSFSSNSHPLTTLPLPDPDLQMIPLDLPTKDYKSTADDLHFCKEHNYCSHNGRCNVESRTCLCDQPWSGEECNQGMYETTIHHNKILITELHSKTMTRDDRADGNELFLAKAHHRLRQVVAELSLTNEPNEELVSEKYRLMRSLGLLYTSPGSSAHELTLSLEPAKVAARHPSHRRLPTVMTMRWKNPTPNDDDIIDAVQTAFRGSLQDAIQHPNQKTTQQDTSTTKTIPSASTSTHHFGIFDERGGGAAGDRDLEKITGAKATTTVASADPNDENAPIRNINTEDNWNADYDKPNVLDVNHEATDQLPGLQLLYPLPTKNHPAVSSDELLKVPLEEDPNTFNDEVQAAVKVEEEHKLKEAALNEKVEEEVNTEEMAFKRVSSGVV